MSFLPVIAVVPYLFILLWAYRNLLKSKPALNGKALHNFISVIIPCRNEEENIESILEDLSSQDYPGGRYEVIIVDDNSSDATAARAGAFINAGNIRLIKSDGSGKKNAILSGVKEASGELIVTADADCRFGKSWLATIDAFYSEHNPALIIMPVAISEARGLLNTFQEMEFLALQGVTAGTALAGSPVMCNGANLAFRKDAYLAEAASLRFDVPSGDDIFLLQAVKKKHSHDIRWLGSESVLAITTGKSSAARLLEQRWRWISKSSGYTDKFTLILGFVTFVTILIQALLTLAAFADPAFIAPAFLYLFLKSVPDLLLILNRAGAYRVASNAEWFVPFQVLYPFYVLAVLVTGLIRPGRAG